tara:strand:+ start:452 stop:1648 length:1197 start_codon:yes stop_codon:yes gene_type:complete
MNENVFDFIVVGGGIVGASTAYKLRKKYPKSKILILDKESQFASHQTGRNSGVIHSGLYYKPGSIKAKTCVLGYHQLVEFCNKQNIKFDICGKIVVAKNDNDLVQLNSIALRGAENGLSNIRFLQKSEVKKIEPYVDVKAALYVPQTGIVNYLEVSERLISLAIAERGSFRLNSEVIDLNRAGGVGVIRLKDNTCFHSEKIIFCVGLQSDRIAKIDGINEKIRIVPFRGDYYKLKNESRFKVRNLIYPVPDPKFPFLGVHFTRMIDGCVECGPNAVFSFSREGYNKTAFNYKDFYNSLSFKGTWKLFKENFTYGLKEYDLAFSKKKYLIELQKIIPSLELSDLIPGRSGIRAQALDAEGRLLDDFLIRKGEIGTHVMNAPSPAATASLAIADEILRQL